MKTWKERVLQWLFPAESDTWLDVLRLGLGLQVTLYALSLQNDWHYLLMGTGNGLIGRNLGEAMLSLEGPSVPRLGWLVSLEGATPSPAYVYLRAAAVLNFDGFEARPRRV